MREVTLRWEREALSSTTMAELDAVVSRLSILGNLHISTKGVRQLVEPVFREGKGVDDLAAIDFLEVKEVLQERETNAIVVFNSHPLVRMATNTDDIHVLIPCAYEEGEFTITVRGLPKAVAQFVRLSEAFIPPASVKVQNITEQLDGVSGLMTQRQFECFQLASKHGYFEEPKRITVQGLAEVMGVARSTFQEHLAGAEQAALLWMAKRLD
jgi:predicted DNA binding protein